MGTVGRFWACLRKPRIDTYVRTYVQQHIRTYFVCAYVRTYIYVLRYICRQYVRTCPSLHLTAELYQGKPGAEGRGSRPSDQSRSTSPRAKGRGLTAIKPRPHPRCTKVHRCSWRRTSTRVEMRHRGWHQSWSPVSGVKLLPQYSQLRESSPEWKLP